MTPTSAGYAPLRHVGYLREPCVQVVFVILPAGMDDPQSAVGFLKRLNPADIAAIFITCGVEDLKTKLEKLEQVISPIYSSEQGGNVVGQRSGAPSHRISCAFQSLSR